MKIKRKILMIITSVLLITSNTTFAEESNNIFEESHPIEIGEMDLKLRDANISSVYNKTKSTISDEFIQNYNVENGETVLLHNNGNSMKTDIFEEKKGNELFAVCISENNGVQRSTYYISNTDKLMDSTVDDIIIDSQNNKSRSISDSRAPYIKDYKWNFYRYLSGPNKTIQQGSLYTEITFNRKTTNANVSGEKRSIWDIVSRSEVKCRSDERINDTYVRLDAKSGSQRLHDFAPETSKQSSFTATLSSIIKPTEWPITAGGYTTTSLSPSITSGYGRWAFKARPGFQKSWVVKPGVRVSNKVGSLYLKYSQTMNLNYSDHSTGVVGITIPDK